MPSVRCTAFMKDDDGHGWSEAHDIDGGNTPDLAGILQSFDALMVSKRVPLLAGDAFYIGARASFKLAGSNQNAGDNIEHDPPLRGQQTMGGEATNMTAPEAAMKTRIRNATATARTDIYIRGFWRQVIQAGVPDFLSTPQGVEWKNRLDQYTLALIAKPYGWLGVNAATTSRGAVTGYLRQADGTVIFTVAVGNAIPLPAAGTKLSIKFAKINNSKSTLNRALVCTVLTPVTVQCQEIIACDDFITNGTYNAIQLGFIPYAVRSYVKLSRRATGRPFGVGRGRAPVQVRF